MQDGLYPPESYMIALGCFCSVMLALLALAFGLVAVILQACAG